MSRQPREVLAELVLRYGADLGKDARRCEALLRDLCGGDQYKREIFVLVSAVREQVPADLLNFSDGLPKEVLLNRLSKRMQDNLGVAKSLANWAVGSWAIALGVISVEAIDKAVASQSDAVRPKPTSIARGTLPGTHVARVQPSTQNPINNSNAIAVPQVARRGLVVSLAAGAVLLTGLVLALVVVSLFRAQRTSTTESEPAQPPNAALAAIPPAEHGRVASSSDTNSAASPPPTESREKSGLDLEGKELTPASLITASGEVHTTSKELGPAASSPVVPSHSEPFFTNSIGMKFALIPAGAFLMGSPDDDQDAKSNEKPQHQVRITQPFYLGTTEVTLGQYRRFVDETGYRTDAETSGKGGLSLNAETGELVLDPKFTWRNPGFPQTDGHPVVEMSWNDAVAFTIWLGKKEGKFYRLPTEAEWEYACRAGTTTRYQSGDNPEGLAGLGNVADGTLKAKLPHRVTISGLDGYVYTSPVSKFRANAYGIYDMHGNAREWCGDWYFDDYYKESPPDDPRGPSQELGRVSRGGSWRGVPRAHWSAFRMGCMPDYCDDCLGFRVTLVVDGSTRNHFLERGRQFLSENQFDKSIDAFGEVLRLDPANFNAYVGRGEANLGAGNLDRAVDDYTAAIRLDTKHAGSYTQRGLAWFLKNKYDNAIDDLSKAIKLDPNSASAHLTLGSTLLLQGRSVEAIAEYREAIRLKPPQEENVRRLLGVALQKQGKVDEAMIEYREAIRLKPDFADAHWVLGVALQNQGKMDEATAEYREAIRLKPDLADAHTGLGAVLHSQGKLEKAIIEYRQAIRLKPDLADAHNNLGICLYNQGKLEEAIVELRDARRHEPSNPTIHSNLGAALIDQGKLEEATAECREAIRLRPNGAEAHFNLGTALHSQRKVDEAIIEYREAIRLKPDLAEAHSNLASALSGKGKLAEAEVERREAKRLNPDILSPTSKRGRTTDRIELQRGCLVLQLSVW